jgi:hypothetical protein
MQRRLKMPEDIVSDIMRFVTGESESISSMPGYLYDCMGNIIQMHQCIFFNDEDGKEFEYEFNKGTTGSMHELSEQWDNHPSWLWDKGYIEGLEESWPDLFKRLSDGELFYIYKKKNMAISNFMLQFMIQNIQKGSTILEFGSGRGTQKLSETFNMLSIEESSDWVDRYDSEYAHVEIENDWYNIDKVNDFIKNKTYDAILIDGPGAGVRNKIVDLISAGKLKLNTDVYIIIDDVEREDGCELSINMSKLLKRECKVVEYDRPYADDTARLAFSYIKPKENIK